MINWELEIPLEESAIELGVHLREEKELSTAASAGLIHCSSSFHVA